MLGSACSAHRSQFVFQLCQPFAEAVNGDPCDGAFSFTSVKEPVILQMGQVIACGLCSDAIARTDDLSCNRRDAVPINPLDDL